MSKYTDLIGEERAKFLLEHQCKTIDQSLLHLPSADFVDKIFIQIIIVIWLQAYMME